MVEIAFGLVMLVVWGAAVCFCLPIVWEIPILRDIAKLFIVQQTELNRRMMEGGQL